MEIKLEDLKKSNDYILVDIRDEDSHNYGFIPGSINDKDIDKRELDKNKVYVLYDDKGDKAKETSDKIEALGYKCFYIEGGYHEYLRSTFKEYDEDFARNIDKALTKRYRRELLSPFCKAINEYQMISPGDKIAVCISGGKDSMLMAKLFQELKRHNKIPFELVFIVMDPGYNQLNRQVIENNAKKLNIPIEIFETRIFDVVYHQEGSPCYLCARMRRGHLYNKAKELGCNKIALGHHYDDVIETILMGMLYGGQVQTMMPKLKATNFEGMELIRPMYLIREKDIIKWRDDNNLHFIQCACRFTEEAATDISKSKRKEIKHLIERLKIDNPYVENNIFKSVMNVNIESIIEYKKDGKRINFLDEY